MKHTRPNRRILATSAAALVALAFLPTASQATPGVWDDGGSPNANWATATNWATDVIPVNGDNLDFSAHAGVANLTVTNNLGALTSIGSITFTNKQFTLAGTALSLSGGIFNNSAVTQTVSFGTTGLTLTAAQQFNAQGGALAVTSAVNLNGNLLTVTGAQDTALSGAVSGGAGITKNGAGTLFITQANTYSGTTTLNTGTLNVGNNTALGTSTLALNGGTLTSAAGGTVLANPVTIGGDFNVLPLAGGLTLSGNVNLGAATRTITNTTTVQNSNVILILSGAISGAGGLTLTSPVGGPSSNYFQFDGATANTYGGVTTVNARTILNLNKTAGVVAIPGDVVINTNGLPLGDGLIQTLAANQFSPTSTVTVFGEFNLVTFAQTVGTLNGTGKVDLSATGILTVGAGNFSGKMVDNGSAGQLVKNTSGTLTLSGANTYTGATKVQNGKLLLGANNTLPTGTDVTINKADGQGAAVLDLNGMNQTIKSLTFIAPTGLGTSNVDLRGGVLMLGGDVFLVNDTTAPGNGQNSFINANGNAASALNLGGATRTFFIAGQNVGAEDLTVEGRIQGTGGVVINATPSTNNASEGGVAFGGANTYSGSTTVARGRLTTLAVGALPTTTDLILGTAASALSGDVDLLGHDQTVNSIGLAAGNTGGVSNFITSQIAPATLTVSSTTTNSTFGGLLTGLLTLVKDGDHNVLATTLTLTKLNTYTGATKVNDGSIIVGSDNALPTATDVTVNRAAGSGNAILNVNGFNQTIHELQLVSPDGGSSNVTIGTGKLTVTGTVSFTDNTTDHGNGSSAGISSSTGFLDLNGGLRNFNVSGNNLTTDLNVDATVQNGGINFTGTQSLAVTGQFGTLGLARANTYAGGTVINDGIVAITNDNNLGAVAGPVTFNDAAAGIPSALRFDSPLTLVAGRTLALNSNGTLDPSGHTSTVASLVTGPGILIIDHINNQSAPGGRVILTNLANNHSGGTAILDGTTLQLDNVAPLGSGPLYFDGGGVLNATGNLVTNKNVILAPQTALGGSGTGVGVIDTNFGTVSKLDGLISGAGQLIKKGGGELILTGSNSYTNGTRIEFGTLSVGSDHALGKGDVTLAVGILRTYNGPRDIHVERNYIQLGTETNGTYNGGTLRLGIGGSKPGQSDRLVVGGTAKLAGTLELVRLNGYQPKRGDKVQLVTAAGGVIGKFVEVENPFNTKGTLLKTEVVYKPTEVDLTAVQGSFLHDLGGLTANQRSVARMLDGLPENGKANKLLDFLFSEQIGNLRNDLDKIAPEELASIFNLGVSLTNVQSANLERRMSDVQAGSAGFSASGYAMNGSGPSYSGDAGYRGPAGKGGKELREPEDARLGVFVTGVGEFTKIGDTSNARGFDLTTGGFTLGVDYKITPNFALGITAGYARTGADLTGNGRLTVDGARAGLYATYFTGTGFYADAAVTGGYNSYSSRRSALKGTARGDTNGGELNALLATGYDWKTGGLTVGPTASVQYTNMGLTSFREHGSLAPLRFKDQFSESLRTALGVKASYDIQAGGVVIRPEARAAWQHEFENTAFALDSRLANGAGQNFTVRGPAIGDDSLLVGAGVAVLWNERTSTYVYYDGELGRTNYSSNNVSGGVRLSF